MRTNLALRYGENPDRFSSCQFLLEVELNCLTDIAHQFVECFTLGEDIDPYPASTPETSIRIYFKFYEHGYPIPTISR